MLYHVFRSGTTTILIIKFHDLHCQMLCVCQALFNYDTYHLHYQNTGLKLLTMLVIGMTHLM